MPDNGGRPRGINPSSNAKTHFLRSVACNALSAYGATLCENQAYVSDTLFPLGIFNFFYYSIVSRKKQPFGRAFYKVSPSAFAAFASFAVSASFAKNKLVTLYSASAASIISALYTFCVSRYAITTSFTIA